MANKFMLEKVTTCLAFISIGLLVSGSDACQENYSVGGQVKNPNATGTATFTPTEGATTGTPDSTGTAVATGTAEGTVTAAVTGTATAVTTATAVVTATAKVTTTPNSATDATALSLGASKGNNLLDELSQANEVEEGAQGASAPSGNWLGQGFGGGGSQSWSDSDGDGFSDDLENRMESDSRDAQSAPEQVTTTDINVRLRVNDSDLDGISNGDEAKAGTDPQSIDSDQDGRSDGAEVLSGGNPLDSKEPYVDSDGDGLGDEFENDNGSDPQQVDSDRDGLRDDLEAVMGTNPRNQDSDSDGVSDGKEFTLGSDPAQGES